jgi:hypothetical protein
MSFATGKKKRGNPAFVKGAPYWPLGWYTEQDQSCDERRIDLGS